MSPIVPLNLPKTELNISRLDGQLFVRCLVRKKNIVLTPEEWVRQHFISYFLKELDYPKGLLTIEKKKFNTEQWKKDGT
jgi:virulence-associated protein VagC